MPAGGTFDLTTVPAHVTISFSQPDVAIAQATGQADPTSVSPIHFSVVFTEPVSGFAGGDVALSGAAGATTAVVTGGPTSRGLGHAEERP